MKISEDDDLNRKKHPDSVELTHGFRIGGMPDHIQDDEWPICKHCGSRMTFYGQLSPIGGSLGNYPNNTPDSSLRFYLFYCFECNEAYSFVQSY